MTPVSDPDPQLEALDPRSRRLIEFTQTLIRTPSLSGEEHAVAALVAAELERVGYRDVTIDADGNVVGYLGQGPPRLMFNGHIDHVPPGDMDDPYGGELVSGDRYGEDGLAIRGRGTCDMKANVAAGVMAATYLDPTTLTGGSFVFVADVQEEPDSPAGIPALLQRGLRAEYGISSESTGLDVSLGHRGKVQLDIVIRGRSSHASTPADGVNAVYGAVPILTAIEAMGADLPNDPLYGVATIAVTGISSTPSSELAVVPNACTIRIDRRYIPSETPEGITRELEELVDAVAAQHGISAEVRQVSVYPLMSIDAGHPLVQAGVDAVASVTGRAPALRTWRFGVNATFMSSAGIPTVGIGPGSEDYAHTRDEHVPVDQLVASSRIYANLIERLCGASSAPKGPHVRSS